MAADDGATLEPTARTVTRLADISSLAWEHPADKGALVALRQLKGFDFILRKLAGLWNERALRLIYLGSAVRVDHRQYPDLYRAYLAAGSALDVADLPELYVIADPGHNAMAIGIDKPIIVVTSGMVELADAEEIQFVLGHELGHVLSGHALYTTMLLQLMRLSATLSWLSIGGLGLRAVLAALHEWARKAELSGDRAGLLAIQDAAVAQRVHMKLAGAGRLDQLDIVAFQSQGDEYLNAPDIRDSLLKMLLLEARTHPFAVVRAAELRRWVESGAYTRIIQGDYPRRTDDANTSIRSDAADAARHYRTAFEESQDPLVSVIRDIGGTVGSAVGWVASRVTGRATDAPPPD
jgi:Zn-dependent protease with chaperone function